MNTIEKLRPEGFGPLRKNQTTSITITGVTSEGNGVGRIIDENSDPAQGGMAVFVPMSVPGDRLRVKIVKQQKTFAYGIIEEIFIKSPARIKPDCPIFSKCGGCAFRQMTYEEELRIKEGFLKDALERIGGFKNLPMEPILPSPKVNGYRNKAQYPVALQNGKAVCGFYSRRSHRVTPGKGCTLHPGVFQHIIDDCTHFMNSNNILPYDQERNSGLVRHIYIRQGERSGEIMVVFVTKSWCEDQLRPLADLLAEKYPQIKTCLINRNSKITNVILGAENRILFGPGYITDTLAGVLLRLSPHSFYQVNTLQAEALYYLAAEYLELKKSHTLLDLYCGAGSIGLSMAGKVKEVVGVEDVEAAVKDAEVNAQLNGISNARFLCADAEAAAETLAQEGLKPDAVVLDPPRKGVSEKTLKTLIGMAPKKILMISCNPATAARDCGILKAGGYSIKKVRAADLFPRTTHIEVVIQMTYCGGKAKNKG